MRDPWPVNGIALAAGERLLASSRRYRLWCERVQRWTATEGAWMQRQLATLPGITPMPSAANYLLIRANQSLVPLREAIEQRHRILLRDCRSFEGLGPSWLRIGLQSRRNNRRIVRALRKELMRSPWLDLGHQRLKQGGQLPFSIPFRQGSHPFTHLFEWIGISRDRSQPCCQEPLNGAQQHRLSWLVLMHDHGRTVGCGASCVGFLVLVCCLREWHQHGWGAAGRQFAEAAGPGADDGQIGILQ